MFNFKKIFKIAKKTRPIKIEKSNEQIKEAEQTKIFTIKADFKEIKQPLPAKLKVIAGNDLNLTIDVYTAQINIGRHSDSQLFLQDSSVSRLHAFILNEDGQHLIYDGKSRNGTYLNGQRITKQTLQHGDIIKIGNTVIVYELQ